jgi:hypothetical protein
LKNSNDGINVFEFYIDEEDKSEDFKNKFRLIKEHLKVSTVSQEAMSEFGYMIIGDYLFIKKSLRLEFLKIFEKDPRTQ